MNNSALIWMLLWLLMLLYYADADADDNFSITVLVASHHPFSDTADCSDGSEVDYNETNPGLLFRYDQVIWGFYRNSAAGCDRSEYSALLGTEFDIGHKWGVAWSGTAAIAGGYPDLGGWGDEYRVWASLNARVGYAKVFYAYRVIGFGLEFDI